MGRATGVGGFVSALHSRGGDRLACETIKQKRSSTKTNARQTVTRQRFCRGCFKLRIFSAVALLFVVYEGLVELVLDKLPASVGEIPTIPVVTIPHLPPDVRAEGVEFRVSQPPSTGWLRNGELARAS